MQIVYFNAIMNVQKFSNIERKLIFVPNVPPRMHNILVTHCLSLLYRAVSFCHNAEIFIIGDPFSNRHIFSN